MPAKKDVVERLLDSLAVMPNGCVESTAFASKEGYPTLKHSGQMRGAHRISYEFFRGKIEAGKYILHSCDNRKCVNPDHLRQGTHAENMADMVSRGRSRSWSYYCAKCHAELSSEEKELSKRKHVYHLRRA